MGSGASGMSRGRAGCRGLRRLEVVHTKGEVKPSVGEVSRLSGKEGERRTGRKAIGEGRGESGRGCYGGSGNGMSAESDPRFAGRWERPWSEPFQWPRTKCNQTGHKRGVRT